MLLLLYLLPLVNCQAYSRNYTLRNWPLIYTTFILLNNTWNNNDVKNKCASQNYPSKSLRSETNAHNETCGESHSNACLGLTYKYFRSEFCNECLIQLNVTTYISHNEINEVPLFVKIVGSFDIEMKRRFVPIKDLSTNIFGVKNIFAGFALEQRAANALCPSLCHCKSSDCNLHSSVKDASNGLGVPLCVNDCSNISLNNYVPRSNFTACSFDYNSGVLQHDGSSDCPENLMVLSKYVFLSSYRKIKGTNCPEFLSVVEKKDIIAGNNLNACDGSVSRISNLPGRTLQGGWNDTCGADSQYSCPILMKDTFWKTHGDYPPYPLWYSSGDKPQYNVLGGCNKCLHIDIFVQSGNPISTNRPHHRVEMYGHVIGETNNNTDSIGLLIDVQIPKVPLQNLMVQRFYQENEFGIPTFRLCREENRNEFNETVEMNGLKRSFYIDNNYEEYGCGVLYERIEIVGHDMNERKRFFKTKIGEYMGENVIGMNYMSCEDSCIVISY